MPSLFEHHPHPYLGSRKNLDPAKVADERGGSALERAGVKITDAVGTMYCAIIFACIALVSLPAAIATRSVIVMVSWLAQTFFQLVLLSIIIVGQNASARSADKRAELTYQDGEASLHMLTETHDHLAAQDAKLVEIYTAVTKR